LSAVKRLAEADVTSELDVSRISNVAVAEQPTASLSPVYPRKLLIMMVALAVGLVLGVGLAVALEWSNDTIRDVEDMESATELICLGTFSPNQAVGRGSVRAT
jgi:succinoglycan biosynthesis transport protein ExoP